MEFWKFLRSDTIKALEDPLIKKILPRYVKVVENELPAKFQIAKRIVFDFDKSLSEKQLWEEHSKLMEKFYEAQEVIDKGKLKIKDLEIPRYSLLDLKMMLTKNILKSCELCERKCHVNRLEEEKGFCRVGSICLISSEFIHMGEEPHISPSHTIFFMGCTFQCQYCFPPDTFIFVNGNLKSIEELFKSGKFEQRMGNCEVRKLNGYTTFTHKCRKKKIIRVSRREYKGGLIVIKPYYLPAIKCTPDHEIFIFDPTSSRIKKIHAIQLKEEDHLVLSKLQTKMNPKTFVNVKELFTEFVTPRYKKSVSRITKDKIKEIIHMKENGLTSTEIGKLLDISPSYIRRLLSKIKKESISSLFSKKYEIIEKSGYVRFEKERSEGIPKLLKITPELARLLGLYCAEGCVIKEKRGPNSYTLVFSYGKKEHKLIDETKRIISNIFDVVPKIVSQRTVTQVLVRKTSISLFFKLLAGENSRTKKVPDIIFNGTHDIVKAFLDGYIEGDGWMRKNLVSMNTVSKELAFGLCYLILRLNNIPRLYVWTPTQQKTIEGRKVTQSPLYYIKFKKKNSRIIEDKNYWFIPIRRIYREKYSGPLYNIEVKNDHSYLANFVSVGNCQNWTISQWFEKGYPLTPMEIAKLIEKRREEGSRNVNFVGGEPTPNLLYILEALKECDANVPTVWNSNFFMSEKTMQILDGIIDLHLSDFKYGNNECALTLSKVSNYFKICSRNHLLATKQAEVTVRHLILPNHVECCSKPILEWISKNIKEKCIVNLMDQYRPEFKAEQYTDINRRITQEEFEEAVNYAKKLNINYIT